MRADTKLHTGIALGIAGVVAVGGQAIAANDGNGPTPANKAIAAGASLKPIGPGTEVPLLTATLRTSKPTDLMLHTTLECTILTKLQTGPSATQGATANAKANASIRGWIEIDDDPSNGETPELGGPERIVPIESASQPPQDGSTPPTGDKAKDSVTYCDRTYERTVQDGENPANGIDRQTDYIDTKSSHAFNWVLLNAGSGIHHVRLVADIVGGATGTCTRDTAAMQGTACTEALVGNRTMIVEPTKMSNDAVISPNAQS